HAMPAAAQWAPDRPARILVGFAAGGTGDLVARTAAELAAPRFGQPVVVENRAGANGMIAAEAAARAAPDGLAVLVCPTGNMTILPELPGARLPVDVRSELAPIANVALSTYGMVVGAAAPWRSAAEFIAAAKARPGALSFASVGTGSAQHLAGERLRRAAGIDLLHVAYRGASLAVVDLIARRADAMVTNLGDVARQVNGGELRLLALGDPDGHPLFPDAPKLGDTLPGFEVTSWLGICGPRGMPPETVAAWSRAVLDGLAEPGVTRRFAENGLRPLPEGPDDFAARMARDRVTWGEVIRAAGIKAE
ncbi:MAG: tripartite tricarboxylate transporter substrate binding protein, partial [Acetobacteraceae bacterium]|nr:tripartite tricarboxylate transporter substrate binding protein [Acetobacteraceae bacterium]